MTQTLASLLIGVIMSVAGGLAIWAFAKKCRLALPPSVWSTEWLATCLSLVLVGWIVTAAAFVVKATVFYTPDDVSGVIIGLVATGGIIMTSARALGRLPDAYDAVATAQEKKNELRHELRDAA
jgi:hypothetical protein